jgi:hypothetical protein
MQKQTKQRGRPKGSNSFVKLKLSDLMSIVGSDGIVPVSKIWLREKNVDILESSAKIQLAAAEEPVAPEEKIEFAITSFEDRKSVE